MSASEEITRLTGELAAKHDRALDLEQRLIERISELEAERKAHAETKRKLTQAEASERAEAKMGAAMHAQRVESDRIWKRDVDSAQAAHRETQRLLDIASAQRDAARAELAKLQEGSDSAAPVLLDVTNLVETIERYLDHKDEYSTVGKLNLVAVIGERVAAKYAAYRKEMKR